jgi:hypothetical protein
MATTTNYGWILPTVGSDVNTWGTVLNNLLNVDTTVDSIDTVVNAISVVADAAMPKAGGIFTGDIELAAGARLTEDQTAMGASEVDWALGNLFTRTLANGANTLTFVNPPTSGKFQAITLELKQGISGNSTVTWPATVRWQDGVAPTLSTSSSKKDVLVFYTYDAGSNYIGAHSITEPS